jgi:hypothetical protein
MMYLLLETDLVGVSRRKRVGRRGMRVVVDFEGKLERNLFLGMERVMLLVEVHLIQRDLGLHLVRQMKKILHRKWVYLLLAWQR